MEIENTFISVGISISVNGPSLLEHNVVYYLAAAHAQSGVKQSVLFVCQSVSRQKILKSVLCTQYTALRNIGLLPFLITSFVHMAPLGSASRSKNL